jgi:hypothetical protein
MRNKSDYINLSSVMMLWFDAHSSCQYRDSFSSWNITCPHESNQTGKDRLFRLTITQKQSSE